MKLTVGIPVFAGFQVLDATGPAAVLEAADHFAGPAAGYRVRLLSCDGGLVTSSSGVTVATEPLAAAPPLDTLLVPGGAGTRDPALDPRLVAFLQQSAGRCRRLASVCTGAFLLARAGLLDGRRATTHWRYAARLARRYPRVRVEPDRIWVNDGPVWTSAGVSAGIDLALALVGDDHGREVARRCAREVVVYYQRPGGQSQFSVMEDLCDGRGRFGPLLAWIRDHLAEPLRVDDLAARVAMSPRHFARRFMAEVGRSPAQAVAQIRLEVARGLVEGSDRPLDRIAEETGFGDGERMRRAFVKTLGHPPRALRTQARQRDRRGPPAPAQSRQRYTSNA